MMPPECLRERVGVGPWEDIKAMRVPGEEKDYGGGGGGIRTRREFIEGEASRHHPGETVPEVRKVKKRDIQKQGGNLQKVVSSVKEKLLLQKGKGSATSWRLKRAKIARARKCFGTYK